MNDSKLVKKRVYADDAVFTYETQPVHELTGALEYKVVPVHELKAGAGPGGSIEPALNALGADNWDLVHYDGSIAIFSRFAEDETKEPESGSV
jgi:hypothetical protein